MSAEIYVGTNTQDSISFDERRKYFDEMDKLNKKKQQQEKNTPFSRWTQFNLDHTQKMMWLQLKHPKAAAIMSFFVDQMDEYNAVMCSYQVLQEVLDTSKATIQRSIKTLKDNGYIAILKSGSSNVYAINDTVYWKSWGNNRQYSKFPANVVLALSEQEEAYQISMDDLQVKKHKEVIKK